MAATEMERKEQHAVQIGAQLISPSKTITAESARIQSAADTSVLASVAKNVSSAYVKAINSCGLFLCVTDSAEFDLNTEFFLQQMTAQDRAAWVADVNLGLLPLTEYHAALRRAGQTGKTNQELADELSSQGPLMSSDGEL